MNVFASLSNRVISNDGQNVPKTTTYVGILPPSKRAVGISYHKSTWR